MTSLVSRLHHHQKNNGGTGGSRSDCDNSENVYKLVELRTATDVAAAAENAKNQGGPPPQLIYACSVGGGQRGSDSTAVDSDYGTYRLRQSLVNGGVDRGEGSGDSSGAGTLIYQKCSSSSGGGLMDALAGTGNGQLMQCDCTLDRHVASHDVLLYDQPPPPPQQPDRSSFYSTAVTVDDLLLHQVAALQHRCTCSSGKCLNPQHDDSVDVADELATANDALLHGGDSDGVRFPALRGEPSLQPLPPSSSASSTLRLQRGFDGRGGGGTMTSFGGGRSLQRCGGSLVHFETVDKLDRDGNGRGGSGRRKNEGLYGGRR